MTTQQLTLELPEGIFQQFARMAKITHQSIESLAIQSISANLPPTIENAPLEIQASLQAMQTHSIKELLKMAHSQIPTIQQQRHFTLLEQNQKTDIIAPNERQELRKLGEKADKINVKKSVCLGVITLAWLSNTSTR